MPLRIGKYRIMRRIGEGTTSEVFLGHDEFNDRPVAVKRVRGSMLRDATDGHVFSRFFASEAALAGRLHHPNVVDIYDAVPDPVEPYLVMEYVPGTTLRAYCQPDHLLPLEQIVEIGFKCAMALGYCYRQGLIHRDVKPANIFAVEAQGVVTDVKIGDFGSALNLTSEATQVHRVGSLAYMSPEQLDGSELDARADIYSLGALLYHLIAGQPPFDGVSQATLMHQICHAHPPSLVNLRTGVTPALDQVVQRCLAKQAGDRYATWDEVGEALSQLVSLHHVPRGALQGVLDSERFTLLRTLDFFTQFGDVALWEVVHRARWQRFPVGHPLYSRGDEGRTFHIIAAGAVEVYREGRRVAQLGSGTSVGEMAYLAPSPELRQHSADIVVTEASTTISFTPDTLARLSPNSRHLFDEAFIRVLVRRLHAAHESLAHPRRIL
ncbi:serine/threonine protein kinase [Sphaerotilus hippei]|uniref:Serine/threonine protein kinase n=2 Tax=Sphaerotilus hippei TaxID=744406 RepID=A0A318H5E1_9BURK|nr:serine/threonine protein kinase [Sphaerotilus hippei]